MQVNPALVKAPHRNLTPAEVQQINTQVNDDWSRFEAIDQNHDDRDPRPGLADAYQPGGRSRPASRFQGEARTGQLWICESLYLKADPNRRPDYKHESVTHEGTGTLFRYEEDTNPDGTVCRLYQIGPGGATLQECLLKP